MNVIDLGILCAYLLTMVGVGVWFSRRSAGGMQAYFLGGNRSKWWMLAASGAASNYDVAGTMFLVSLFYVVGLRSFWLLWSWQFFAAAFLMGYMAVWVRRTGVMTAVELMRIRFGEDMGGRMARTAGAILMVTFLVTSIGYAFSGIQKFMPIILPDLQIGDIPEMSGKYWAMIIMGLTLIYVVSGGFSGVVVTDFIQTLLMSLAGILVGVIVWYRLDPAMVETLHAKFSTDLLPKATLETPDGYESWRSLWQMSIYWFFAGVLIHMNGAGGHYQEQRFLATRTNADAARTGFAWGFYLIPRWAMIAGFVCIAATGMVQTDDPEQILPVVIVEMIPTGVRGLLLAGLVAAFMSTFSSVVNAAAGMIVRDLIQPFCPKWGDRTLVRISYVVTIMVVIVGVTIGFHTDSIKGIWTWMMAGLIGGMLIPNILRWHWWRLNGWGYSFGLFGGLMTAFGVGLFSGDAPEYIYGPVIWGVTVLGCLAGSLLTRPTSPEVLVNFYRKVRPWGAWRPIRDAAGELSPLGAFDRSPARIALNVILALTCLMSSYIFVFFAIGHFTGLAVLTALLAIGAALVLYFTWYRMLPQD